MVGSITINYIGRSAMSIAGPDIAKQYGFSEAELGQIFAAFWLGYAVMMWPSGWLADRFGAARVLGICGGAGGECGGVGAVWVPGAAVGIWRFFGRFLSGVRQPDAGVSE
jgi:MFS family permease